LAPGFSKLSGEEKMDSLNTFASARDAGELAEGSLYMGGTVTVDILA
jgi:hypothetical protein